MARPAIVYIQEKFTAYVTLPEGTLTKTVYNGKPLEINATCTGFGVNPDGYIATAGHCVDTTSRNGIKYEFVARLATVVHERNSSVTVQEIIDYCLDNCTVEGQLKGSPPDAEISVLGGATVNGSAQARPARVVDFRPFDQGDVALLKIDAIDQPQPSIELAPGGQLQIGTPVLAIGYPGNTTQGTDPDLDPTNKDGQISSKKSLGPGSVYEISAAVSAGMSGGPTISLDGRVLGINSFKAAGETQPFNFIAPTSGLSELLNRNGVHNQLGPNDVIYRQGLADYFSGHYSNAIADFDKLLAVSPRQPQALQYKTLAANALRQFGDPTPMPTPPPMPPAFGIPLWVLIGIATALILLILAAVVIALLLRQRSRGRQAEPPHAPAESLHAPAPMGSTSPTTGYARPISVTDAARLTTGADFCPNCATARTPSARFCANCGTPQS